MKKYLIFLIVTFILCLPLSVYAEMDQYKQLDLIADSTNLWKQEIEYGLWGYTVTDLDQNGRLEIISASLQGTGMYTYIQIFEVDPESTGLTEVRQDRPEYESAPDIMFETAPVFCDPESQICYYIFTDFIRNGYAENYENKRGVYLDEGIWKEIDLARKATIFSDPENFTVTFSDPEGNELSEDRYESAEDTYFAGCEKGILRLNWNMTDTESFAQMSREELRGALENVSFFEPAESE